MGHRGPQRGRRIRAAILRIVADQFDATQEAGFSIDLRADALKRFAVLRLDRLRLLLGHLSSLRRTQKLDVINVIR